jgi:hypothetical protein
MDVMKIHAIEKWGYSKLNKSFQQRNKNYMLLEKKLHYFFNLIRYMYLIHCKQTLLYPTTGTITDVIKHYMYHIWAYDKLEA